MGGVVTGLEGLAEVVTGRLVGVAVPGWVAEVIITGLVAGTVARVGVNFAGLAG